MKETILPERLLKVRKHGFLRFWFSLVVMVMMSVSVGWGQTNPTAQDLPYSQNFGTSTFTTMPTGMAAWSGLSGASLTTLANAEASSPSSNATLTAATAAQTGGGTYGYATSSNGRIYVQTSSNTTAGANQIAIALNTTGKDNINISYDIEIISAQPRTVGIVMQYRIGTSGSWTTVSGIGNPYSQAGGTTGVKASPSLTLPNDANNQSVVQIRWATWRGTETGNSSGIAIDNISVSGTDISSGDSPPTLTADNSDNTVDNNIEITFTDNPTWRSAITSITVGGTTLATAAYSISEGKITLDPSESTLLQSPGSKSIVVIATGYSNASVTQTINVGAPFKTWNFHSTNSTFLQRWKSCKSASRSNTGSIRKYHHKHSQCDCSC
jgi:hypothetical protein